MSVSVGLMALVDARPGPLVLAAVLAITIARNKLVRSWRGRIEAVVLLPFIALATAGEGNLLVSLPLVGALAFVVAMFLSIFLRRFGAVWTRVGSLIALPFITLLIAPGAGAGLSPLEVALLSIGVLVLVVGLRLLAEATGFLPRMTDPQDPVDPQRASGPRGATIPPQATEPPQSPGVVAARNPNPTPRGMRPIASTRMAIQMAIALAAAFIAGGVLFPSHVTWVVLTAFIVCSGNRGRADVVYKSGLRVVGAAIGTILGSLDLLWLTPATPSSNVFFEGPALVVILLAIISLGLWLREWTYAAWAVVMTLVITLLQGTLIHLTLAAGAASDTGIEQLWVRILAIILGAVCGLAASWFVLPVRSDEVIRRRVADALRALSNYAANTSPATGHVLDVALGRLDEVAAPWSAYERVTRWRKTSRKPGQWIQLVQECAHLVLAHPQLSAASRRALGDAQRSMRDSEAILGKLLELRDTLRSG